MLDKFTNTEIDTQLLPSSGLMVRPRYVESVLRQHPAILDVSVTEIPHPYRGQTTQAAVVLKPGEHVSPDYLIGWSHEYLPAFQVPSHIEIVDTLS